MPNATCDFYFKGYPDAVPTFRLAQVLVGVQVVPDVIKAVGLPPSLEVEVDSFSFEESDLLVCPNTSVSLTVPGITKATREYARTILEVLASFNVRRIAAVMSHSCVKLALYSVEIAVSENRTAADHLHLTHGDGNTKFPEDRRCLMFRLAV